MKIETKLILDEHDIKEAIVNNLARKGIKDVEIECISLSRTFIISDSRHTLAAEVFVDHSTIQGYQEGMLEKLADD